MNSSFFSAVRNRPQLGKELRRLWSTSWPVALAQVGFMLSGVVDTLMVSRISVEALAAFGLASSLQWSLQALGFGVVLGMAPLVSQQHGAGNGEAVGLTLQRGVLLGLLAALPVCLALLFTEELLLWSRQDAHVAQLAHEFTLRWLPGIPAFLVFTALRESLQGREIMAPATWVTWLSIPVNAGLNALLIWGTWGFPELGLNGAGIASSITRTLQCGALAVCIVGFGLQRGAWQGWSRQALRLKPLFQLFWMGAPIGLQLFLESTAFTLAVLSAGQLGVVETAAHQVTLNMAAVTFMVPLGISMAASARVGNLVGEADGAGVHRAMLAGLVLGGATMLVFALLFVVLRYELPRLYSDNTAVIALSASILPLAGAFQMVDGLQVVAAGLLRGIGRPQIAALVHFVSFYLLAVPVGYWLTFAGGFGLQGIWIALALGLLLVTAGLVFALWRYSRMPVEQFRVSA